MSKAAADAGIVTPVKGPGLIGRVVAGQSLPGLAARLGASIGRVLGKPLRIGRRVIAVRHAHVTDLLRRDGEFGIAPINKDKIEAVNGGPFVLGMDRSEVLERERRALYAALAATDFTMLKTELQSGVAARLRASAPGAPLDVVSDYARPLATRTAQLLFGVSGPDDDFFMEVARSIFGHTFLNIGNDAAIRDRAIKAGAFMQQWLTEEIARRRAAGELKADMMGMLLRQEILDDDGVRRTLGGMLVGSIDTTTSCVAKIVKVASGDPALYAAMVRDRNDLQRLNGWCNEALRRWPHNPIVLRQGLCDADLGGCAVRAGDTVLAWTQAAMLDPAIFPEPERLRPDREPASYLHLGGGVHPCAGRAVNRFQIPMLVAGLLDRGFGRVGAVGWAGPFPNRLIATLN